VRILLSTDCAGGVWDYTTALAGELSRRGHKLLIAVLGDPSLNALSHVPAQVEVTTRSLRLEWMPDAWSDVDLAGAWLVELAQSWRADLIHLNQLGCPPSEFPGPTLVVAHSDVLSWWREVRGEPAPAEWREYARRVRAGLAAADAVVAPSAYQSSLLELHYGRRADRVIWNGLGTPTDARRAGGRRLDRRSPLLVTAARAWDLAKGIRVLDEALVELGARAPATVVLGSTKGPAGQSFVARRVALAGSLERAEVDAWLERATLYVAPSLYEPFGLAPVEAALHGCPLLLSDIESFRELWGATAAYAASGDAPGLAAAIDALIDDSHRLQSLAAAARDRALERFTAERMASEYEELYQTLLRNALERGRSAPVALAPAAAV
jgi:glycogen(starch) synthase